MTARTSDTPILETQDRSNSIYKKKRLRAAYRYCHDINRAHYENFPVASLLMPKAMRPAIDAVYAFSRTADDFADEAEFHGVRFERLDEWARLLDESEPTHPVFIALKDARERHSIPKNLLLDLLTAFRQDVEKNRYADFSDVLKYCHYSANPVGRLVLHVAGVATDRNMLFSDAICTALQLTNFWQDIGVDLKKDRIYLPQNEMHEYSVADADLFSGNLTEAMKRLIVFQVSRTRELFRMGHELGLILTGRLGLEIRLTWLTGMQILDKVEASGYDVLRVRPVLTKMDFAKMLWVAASRERYKKHSS